MSVGSQQATRIVRWSGPGRLLAGLLVIALLVALLPADARGQEQHGEPVDTATGPLDTAAVTSRATGFGDVPAGHVFEEEIGWLASTGITQGRGDGTFGLNDAVTRGAMAAFLYRFSDRPAVPVAVEGFDDVPAGHVFEGEVAWLASTGITQGRGDGTFGLHDAVTRGAMAAFLYRAAGGPDVADGAPAFADVPAGQVFATEIAWLASTGITQGRDDGTFGLGEPVTRGQMAAFLSRFDDWLLPMPGAVFVVPDDGQAQLGWIPVPLDDLTYRVERASSRWGPWELVEVTATGADTLTIEGLTNGQDTYFRVRSQAAAGQSSLVSEAVGVVPVALPAIDPQLSAGTIQVPRSQVLAATPGQDGRSLVTLHDEVPVDGPGQLLVIEPSPPMPRGMLAEVVEVTDPYQGPGQQLLLANTAMDEVFDDPHIDWDLDLTPQPVDDVATALLSTAPQRTFDGGVTTVGLPTGAFSCNNTGGLPLSPEAVWETGNPFPVKLELREPHVNHVYDPGSRVFNRRDPLLILQFSGQTVTTIGATAKLGVTCELSTQWRRNHPIFSAYIGTIAGVPVSVTLEPAFSIDISTSGQVSFTETRYFTYTVEKDGDQPVQFNRAGSADPPEFTSTAGLTAEVFAGGDLSVLLGGGVGPATTTAGLFLEFGPALTAATTTNNPDCATLDLSFNATGGIRLELWIKRWNLELASATHNFGQLAEYCASTSPAPADPDADAPPSGTSWTRIDHDEQAFGGDGVQAMRSVTAGGPGVVAVGNDSSRDAAAVWTSPDGVSWQRIPHDEAAFGGSGEQLMRAVVEGGPGLVAVGRDIGAGAVWTSGDGTEWRRAAHDPSMFSDSSLSAVTVGGLGLIAVGRDTALDAAAVWTSPDGLSWRRVAHDEGVFGGDGWQEMSDITAGGPGLVAVGSDSGAPAVWTSADGTSWQRAPRGQEALNGGTMSAVTAGGPGLVAVGSDPRLGVAAAVWVSSDGSSWQRISHDESVFGGEGWQMMRSVVDTGAGLVAIGGDTWARGAAWTSPDGIGWERIPHEDAAFGGLFGALDEPIIFDLAMGGPGLVAVGAGGGMTDSVAAVWTSP